MLYMKKTEKKSAKNKKKQKKTNKKQNKTYSNIVLILTWQNVSLRVT